MAQDVDPVVTSRTLHFGLQERSILCDVLPLRGLDPEMALLPTVSSEPSPAFSEVLSANGCTDACTHLDFAKDM